MTIKRDENDARLRNFQKILSLFLDILKLHDKPNIRTLEAKIKFICRLLTAKQDREARQRFTVLAVSTGRTNKFDICRNCTILSIFFNLS